MSQTKRCNGCGIEKPLSEYHFHMSGPQKNTPMSRCKPCRMKATNDWRHATGKTRPLSQATDSASYLGVHIAERVLGGYFDNMERMPYSNPGFDFVCGNGYKIDVKSSCAQTYKQYRRWNFHVFQNMIADYFLCIAFDNRESLTPQHVWLIPSNEVNSKLNFKIYDTTKNLLRWSRFERPVGKAITRCQKMRTEGGS